MERGSPMTAAETADTTPQGEGRALLPGAFRGRALFDVPLSRFTSMRVGGPADVLLFPQDRDDLRNALGWAKKSGIPILILGRGTNLIVLDGGFRGWVISLARGFRKVTFGGESGEVAEAEAGASLRRLVQLVSRRGLSGFEPFIGIPGTVGGGLAMNAGAWGSEIRDRLETAVLLTGEGDVVEKNREELDFGYRRLMLPPSWVILSGRFRLTPGDPEEIRRKIEGYAARRRETQPLEYPSAGSVFKNPPEGPAGKWIEAVGLKGFRMGQAMVSDRHANFIVNLGGARADEILRLMERVEDTVREKKGISLEREVKVVGERWMQ
jgi:UDP-N-acetylmuramate dehydrogenase